MTTVTLQTNMTSVEACPAISQHMAILQLPFTCSPSMQKSSD